jgi:metal-responsive CopG/Arc/MetJ family transcriptional regulator
MPKSRFSLWIPNELKDRLEQIERKEGLPSISAVICMLLTRAVAQYEQKSS